MVAKVRARSFEVGVIRFCAAWFDFESRGLG